jgi:hypothetical protein
MSVARDTSGDPALPGARWSAQTTLICTPQLTFAKAPEAAPKADLAR